VPSLDLRFADNKSLTDAVTGASLVTFTRASSGTYVNSAGVLQTAATDVPRFDHNPTTLESLGLLVEEQRTNSIRNNTMVGAVAGTPGTVPTNWSDLPTSNGLSGQIVGVGTQLGITYIDIRYSGTTTAASSTVIQPELSAQTVAATGQSWTASSWLSLAGGSTSGLTFAQRVTGRTSIGGFLENTDTSVSLTGTLTRYAASIALANVLTARASCDIVFSYASGAVIDITLRIGLPQLEQGAFATSPILTSTAAVTRSADVASITGSAFSSWYRQDEGTMFVNWIRSTNVTGAGRVLLATDGTINNRNYDLRQDSSSGLTAIVINSTNLEAALSLSLNTLTGRNLLAFGMAANNAAASANGGAASLDNSLSIPVVNRLEIGSFVGTAFINGTIRRLCYWNQRLANSTLQGITS
jgi:hypothetical protein